MNDTQSDTEVTGRLQAIWALRILAQPAGYRPDFLSEWPREDAEAALDDASVRWAQELGISVRDFDFPPHVQMVRDALFPLIGSPEKWTEDAVTQLPEWRAVQSLVTAALTIEGKDSAPPEGPFWPPLRPQVDPPSM